MFYAAAFPKHVLSKLFHISYILCERCWKSPQKNIKNTVVDLLS